MPDRETVYEEITLETKARQDYNTTGESREKQKKEAIMNKVILATLLIGIIFLSACSGTVATPQSIHLSPSEIAALQDYTNVLRVKLDGLYVIFEANETQAKKIADDRQAPYNMAIGSMAEVRKFADEIQSLNVPKGADRIYEITINTVHDLQNDLNEIASKDASNVSLTDPGEFYVAYLDVLIEIPKLKQEILKLAKQ